MMNDREQIAEILRDFEKTVGATPDELARVEAHFGCVLPQQYKEFLLLTNGGYGWVGENYLSLYSVEDVIEADRIFSSDEQEPLPFFVFASNGGLEAYAFDRTQAHLPIINFPFIGWDDTAPYGEDFLEFLELRAADGY